MNDADLLDLLVAVEVLDGFESDLRVRLLHQEKRDIVAAIEQHGRSAISQLNKDNTVIYCRESARYEGPDAAFLCQMFGGAETLDVGQLRYDGPETLLLVGMDRSFPGQAVIGSWSPFSDRAAYQVPPDALAGDHVMYGYQFAATMQIRNSLQVLQQHGRIERCLAGELPQLTTSPWQGTWLPKTRPWADIVPGIGEPPMGQMASDIGAIDNDGGDYLRFLLLVKRVMACALSDTDKASIIARAGDFQGEGGHSFSRFMDFHGGVDTLTRKLSRA